MTNPPPDSGADLGGISLRVDVEPIARCMDRCGELAQSGSDALPLLLICFVAVIVIGGGILVLRRVTRHAAAHATQR